MQHQRWGKAPPGRADWKPLIHHMLDVAAVLAVGLERRPALLDFLAAGFGMGREETRAMLLTLAGLHDIGKVAASFQALNPDLARKLGVVIDDHGRYSRRCGHDRIGYVLLLTLLRERRISLPLDPARLAPDDIRTLLAVTCGHHGLQPVGDWRQQFRQVKADRLLFDEDLPAAIERVDTLTGLFAWRRETPSAEGVRRLSYFLNGLLILCDWLGSSDAMAYADPALEPAVYWREHALPNAARVVAEIQPALFRPLSPRPPAAFGALFGYLARNGASPRPTDLQATVDRLFTAENLPAGPLLVVIEDLPGSGKTEAGDLIAQRLIALGRADGLYAGLPTMVTANAAFARKFTEDGRLPFGDALFDGNAQTVLAHSKRHRVQEFRTAPTRAGLETGEAHALDWFTRSSRRALLADLGVGTVDQALAGAMRARHATLRLAGLWRKVLVIDEVHAYDDYMQVLLAALLRWQGMMGHPVVLMSATLPSRIRGDLIAAYAQGAGWTDIEESAARIGPGAYPLLTLVHQGGIDALSVKPAAGPGLRPVRLAAAHSQAEVDDRIRDWLAAGRSVIWFRNTVDDAVTAWERWQRLAREHGGPTPLLYHARFLPADRAAAEQRLLAVAGKTADPANRRSQLVIATQAAEQSLDLDFDELVTDLAPADAVCQRLGRRRRHARTALGDLAADGKDQRPADTALLHMPPLEPAPSHWYAQLSRGTAAIYDNDAQLWLSARLLLDPSRIDPNHPAGPDLVIARDLRPLLERVYADPGDETFRAAVPAALLPRTDQAEGNDLSERQQGRQAALPFRGGLLADWDDPVRDDEDNQPRTRLGEQHRVILATLDGATPRFLMGNDEPLEESECPCPMRLDHPDRQKPWRDQLAASLPPAQRLILENRPLLFLSPGDDGLWRGEAEVEPRKPGQPKERKHVTYSARRGLVLVSQADN